MEDQDRIKAKLDREVRSNCLDRALNLYGAAKYTAGNVKMSKPEDVIDAAKKFYTYIKEGE